jgi:DNA-binding response OmpR family regulator
MRTVWIVDDDDEMSQAVARMFKLLAFQARIFREARSPARALLAGESPDLMILDINMPEVSGLDLLEFVRRRIVWNHIPIVMLSAETSDVQIDQALKLGADGYLCKPVSLKELDKTVRSSMERRSARSQ